MMTEQLYKVFQRFPVVSTDSRTVSGGCLFFGLKGENFNGNLYAAEALAEGAARAVVDDPEVATDDRFILVEDVLTALQQLAAYHRKTLGIPVIGITGTNGKTTTKELIAQVLGTTFRIEYTRGNLNNHIGVPMTLLSFSGETKIGVVEMGANHPGEIDFLCRLADPDYGLVTNIGKAHLEGFGGFEGVVRTKSELYRYLEEKKGIAFVNGENPLLMNLSPMQRVIYGCSPFGDVIGEITASYPFLKLKFWFDQSAGFEIKTQLCGDYNFENVLAAVAVGRYFGVKPLLIKYAIENYTPSNSRSQFMQTGTNTVIMDAYNANPSSMEASIRNFLRNQTGNKYFLLGDMLELGEESAREHQQIVDLLAKQDDCDAYLVGSCFSRTIRPDRFLTFDNVDEMIQYLTAHPIMNASILIKGSHGMKMQKLAALFR